MVSLPYVTSPGSIPKALDAIKKAAVPERVSQDFVMRVLKIPGGSGRQITTFLKKIGLANTDGTPSALYKRFRNPSSAGAAIAEVIRQAYEPLYKHNEYMHELDDKELLGLVVEVTGQPHDSNPVKLVVNCIKQLKAFAEFYAEPSGDTEEVTSLPAATEPRYDHREKTEANGSIGLNLGYTINLNLPVTSDPAVFDAIFKSLRENLLKADDA